MRTVSRVYDNYSDAVAVVTDLEAATDLRPDRQISMIANENAHGRDTTVDTTRTETKSEAGPGAGIGAIVGGGVGLLTGLGLLAIPGVGPLVAAGWLATTLAGAATGAAVGGIAVPWSSPVSPTKKPRCMKKECAEAARWSACRLTRRMCRRSKRFSIAAPRRIGARVESNIARPGGSRPRANLFILRLPRMGPQGPILLATRPAWSWVGPTAHPRPRWGED